MEEAKQLASRADEFLQLFKRGAEFTQDLLKENERLRFRILALERNGEATTTRVAELQPEQGPLLERIRELEAERESILARIRQVEEENQDFAQRYIEIEEENNNLANLYVASYQLHSTLDFQEVLQIIVEIVINLVGAEEFALFLVSDRSEGLQPAVAEGLALEEIPAVAIGEGIVGGVARSGEIYYAEQAVVSENDILSPLVCIPLKIKDDVIGVLSISKLLVQKTAFVPVDFELFTMLAAHAATAIFASRLYTAAERKLTTIQGFLDLLTRRV